MKLAPLTKAKTLERVRSFWRFAVNREWVARSPVTADPETADRRDPCRQ
jgi:hypothetical protein